MKEVFNYEIALSLDYLAFQGNKVELMMTVIFAYEVFFDYNAFQLVQLHFQKDP